MKAQMTTAAFSLRELLEAAGRVVPATIADTSLGNIGELDENVCFDLLVEHLVAGQAFPSAKAHETIAFELAERVGARRTVEAIVAAAHRTTFSSPGNIGNSLLAAMPHSLDGDISDVLEVLLDIDDADVAREVARGMAWAWDVGTLQPLTDRFGFRWAALTIQKSKNELSADDVAQLAKSAADAADVLAAPLSHTLLNAADALMLLDDDDERVVAAAVTCGLWCFGDDCWSHQAFAGNPVIAQAAVEWSYDRWIPEAGHQLVETTVCDCLDNSDVAMLLRLNSTYRASLFERDAVRVALERFYRFGDARAVASLLSDVQQLNRYAELTGRLDVVYEVSRLDRFAATRVVSGISRFLPTVGERLLADTPGVAAEVARMLETTTRPSELSNVVCAVDDFFTAAENASGVVDARSRLWAALVAGRATSPAADDTLSLREMCDVLLTRWAAAAARVGAKPM